MNSKKKPKPVVPSRSMEMHSCEKAILELFEAKHITVSEALFIFEKIKFSALYGTMASQIERPKALTIQGSSSMFR
jgi:hypothetical protein